ncbi:hypothetical protein [Endozoicomonas sp. 8E]|uniref:hypothetical protein n=1 Tax=Endozoicomonas sp. 8E TaxID=3035692 RepID=UPI00293943E1|nr:hypothetical protein [Endozoicomonas sp. 8E]WOG26908.1 hypothetical protein P6910_20520 [Endozoicomonas sp. 8E]
MIKHPLPAVLLLLLSLPVTCQAQMLTKRYIVELQQNTGSQDKSFPIQQHYPHTLPNDPTIIAKTNDYAESNYPTNNIPFGPGGYGLKTGIIESISWNLLYASHLLVAYELTLTTKDTYLNSNIYSWLPFIVIGPLLNSYWNPDSPMFNTIGQQELSQDYPFVINTMTHSPGDNPQQGQPSTSSDQQAPQATNKRIGYFTPLLYSNSGNGNEDPEKDSHTLGLICFVHPCRGICRFRPSSDSEELAEADEDCPICFEKFSNATITPCCSKQIDTHCLRRMFLTTPSWSMKTCPLCRADMNFLAQSPGFAVNEQAHHNLPTCDVLITGRDGQQRRCGKICRNVRALSAHRRRYHYEQETCDVTIIRQDGQQQPCGKVCRNARELRRHQRIDHSGQQTCDLTIIRQDGQPGPCGKVCRNIRALTRHRVMDHSGQQTCDVTITRQDGLPRPCGKVCTNVRAMLHHKRRKHSATNR